MVVFEDMHLHFLHHRFDWNISKNLYTRTRILNLLTYMFGLTFKVLIIHISDKFICKLSICGLDVRVDISGAFDWQQPAVEAVRSMTSTY
jgi:hypothetical protein